MLIGVEDKLKVVMGGSEWNSVVVMVKKLYGF